MGNRFLSCAAFGLLFFFTTESSWARSFREPSNLLASDLKSSVDVGELKKKRILVLTDTGGGGHVSASQAIQKALGGQYEIEDFYLLEEFPGHYKYNEYLSEGALLRLGLPNSLQRPAEFLIGLQPYRSQYVQKLEDFKPDLVLSVFPVANAMTYQEAHRHHIPFLVLSNNYDSRHFFHGIHYPEADFKFGLPLAEEDLKTPLQNQLKEENFVVTGTPLREEFGKTLEELAPSVAQVQKELGNSDQDKIVAIMMGAQGMADAVMDYTQKIVDASEPILPSGKLHVVAVCGKNQSLQEGIHSISQALQEEGRTDIQVHALGPKDGSYIAALMKMANTLVTKPGGSSVNEGVATGIYSLYHSGANFALPWEGGNMRYSQSKGWGEEILPHQFIEQLKRALTRDHFKYDPPGKKFKENLENVIEQMTRKL